MKIVFDCERMKYPYTGLFEYCHKLASALKSAASINDDVVLYLQQKDQHFFSRSFDFINQKSFHKVLFPAFSKDIKLWHTTHQTSWYMPPGNRKVRRLITVHDLNFIYEEESEKKRGRKLKKHQELIDKADHIVAISEFTKQDILKYLVVKKPISVIYNGCDFEVYPEFNIPVYKPTNSFIFTIGTVIPKKNFHTLPCLLVNNNFQLIISGKENEDYVKEILAEAKRYDVLDRVHITGPISKEDKYWYYKNCSAFAFPSLAEGFGIPVIEAMNFGKPVFLSTCTSLPEIGGEHAYYFPNFEPNSMQKAFDQGMEHYKNTQPAEKIKQHAQQFSWETCAKAHWALYKSLANS
ncbi:glycosyltransferase family 4 protein [Pedobacter jejuensis]|uniref:Glycosyltransferase family 1 protein n=1 Tax=Pedobacter jejuensis TaxID=1268550 RepID=A0A3N0BLT1_9SPHI|nr:glycosyltransferase family 1 protein [Pedobacter jejuensis]RNL49614.1 glycosyltransferase family 1 protein [Pedobacter jejuensis]